MNPGLVVKLRPSGPWRIGPDSGARNRVDVIYHSDSLYSAVTSAMSRIERLEEWLDATARSATPAVCFSSCYPFIEDIGFVIPPRTVWPPATPSLMAGKVRWKSARFIPLAMVQSILAGERLDGNRWSVDGPSGCLLPSGRQGPFRTSVRWSAAVDRLSGASERHSTACIEFRPGAGLWTVIGFTSEATRDQWQDAIKTAFRLLADTGFGGERSRGWGRSEAPEFIEGELPAMIIGEPPRSAEVEAPPVIEEMRSADSSEAPPTEEPVPGVEEPGPPAPEPAPESEASHEEAPVTAAGRFVWRDGDFEILESSSESPEDEESEEIPKADGDQTEPEPEGSTPAETDQAAGGPEPEEVADGEPEPEPEPVPVAQPAIVAPRAKSSGQSHWMLSLFTPAPADTVDWARGSYTLVARGGRIDSPAGSGELKKQIQMIAEGSVLVAESVPRGAAPDVAPDGFAHPVFRAGFALAIPLPEGN